MRLSSEILARNLAPRGTTFFCPSCSARRRTYLRISRGNNRSGAQSILASQHVGGSRIAEYYTLAWSAKRSPPNVPRQETGVSRAAANNPRQLATYLPGLPFIPDIHRCRCFEIFHPIVIRVITQSRCQIRGQRVNLIVAVEDLLLSPPRSLTPGSKLPLATISIAR